MNFLNDCNDFAWPLCSDVWHVSGKLVLGERNMCENGFFGFVDTVGDDAFHGGKVLYYFEFISQLRFLSGRSVAENTSIKQ